MQRSHLNIDKMPPFRGIRVRQGAHGRKRQGSKLTGNRAEVPFLCQLGAGLRGDNLQTPVWWDPTQRAAR